MAERRALEVIPQSEHVVDLVALAAGFMRFLPKGQRCVVTDSPEERKRLRKGDTKLADAAPKASASRAARSDS